MAELLGIPDDVMQTCLPPAAYYTGETFRPARRVPAPERTYWDGWGQPRQGRPKKERMSRKAFDKELEKLQVELCRLQAWVVQEGLRVVVVFEGRDAAGKGGVIKRITERVSPRIFRVVALPAPTDREKTQLYVQRYIPHFPAAGEIVLFDRSWYNRAGVERVMGFCTDDEYERFMRMCPLFEREVIGDGVILIKYFFELPPLPKRRKRDKDTPDTPMFSHTVPEIF